MLLRIPSLHFIIILLELFTNLLIKIFRGNQVVNNVERAAQSHVSTETTQLDSDELRKRRLARFQQSTASSPPQDPVLADIVSPHIAQSEKIAPIEAQPQKPSTSGSKQSILLTQTRPSSEPAPSPSLPPQQETKANPGVLLLRDLGISIRGFTTASSSLRTSSHSYSKPIEIDYNMAGRDTGPEVHEVDSLLFCVGEKLNAPQAFLKYLMTTYKRNMSTRSNRAWAANVVRSVQTQIILLLEQESSTSDLLTRYLESACAGADVMHYDDDYLSPMELQSWISSFASRVGNREQLSEMLNSSITQLVNKLSTMQSIATKVLPTLSALRLFFSHHLLRSVLIAHPYWNASSSNTEGPQSFEKTILGVILSISCVQQPDTGIQGFSSSSISPSAMTDIRASLQSVSNSLMVVRSIIASIISDLVSTSEEERGESSSGALLRWINTHVLNAPIKPHSTHYLLQWQHSPELQRRDGFYTNLVSAMLRATQLAGDLLGSDPSIKRASIDLNFFESNIYGIEFPEKSLLLDLEHLQEKLEERSDSQRAPFRTASHSKFNAFFLTTWLLIQSTYVPALERFHTITETMRRTASQERSLASSPEGARSQMLMMARQQLASISSRMYSSHIALSQLTEPLSVFMDFTADWLLETLHIDLSDTENPESIALYESFDSEARRNGEKNDHLPRERPTPDADLLRLPAFIFESITAHYKWRLAESPHVPFADQYDRYEPFPRRVLQLLTHLFAHSHLKNPHVSKAAIEVFAALFAPLKELEKARASFMGGVSDSRIDIERLVYPLIRFYVGVEKSGPRAFYDKFPVRRLIGSILCTPSAHGALLRACLDHALFMPFIMVLLNDSLYLLDETMLKLKSITELQATVSRLSGQAQRSADDQQALGEAEQNLQSSMSTLTALSTFGNDSMTLFEVLSSVSLQALVSGVAASSTATSSPDAARSSLASSSSLSSPKLHIPVILDPNILEQLSVMLNYFLDQFATPSKRRKLQVTGNDSIDRQGALAFNPRQILSCLVLTYLNMDQMCAIIHSCASEGDINKDTFRKAIVSESRSYSIGIFEEALKIIIEKGIPFTPTALRALRIEWEGNNIGSSSSSSFTNAREAIAAKLPEMELIDTGRYIIERLKRFIGLVKDSEDEARELDIPESDIPERFLDAIMATLMRDPVKLPSGHIVDRSTIVRQLAGHDKSDPFTRLPMTIDQVVSEYELKEEIESWLKEMRKADRVK